MKLPACAIIAVPDHLHYEVASACLEKGLHTLVVKPLTPTVKEAKKLVSLAKKQTYMEPLNFTSVGTGRTEFCTIYINRGI